MRTNVEEVVEAIEEMTAEGVGDETRRLGRVRRGRAAVDSVDNVEEIDGFGGISDDVRGDLIVVELDTNRNLEREFIRDLLAYNDEILEEDTTFYTVRFYFDESPEKDFYLMVDYFSRGYTGHEHMDMFGLINMNGRMYDPTLGRMLSPDPYVPDGTYTQDFNRYMYARNNPLTYTDPDGEFILRYLSGFIKGVVRTINQGKWVCPFSTGAQTVVNSWKMTGGLFAGDGSQIWSRFTKELPQTLGGFIFARTSNLLGQVDKVEYYDGATVSSGRNFGNGGAIALGSFISGSRNLSADPNNPLFQHEYGHYLQSQAYGWKYLTKVGLVSLRNVRDKNMSYDDYIRTWTEQDANERAYEYFYKKTGGTVDWNFRSNPILNEDWVNKVQNMYSRRNPMQPMYNPIINPVISNHLDWPLQEIDDYRPGRRRTPSDRLRNLLLLYK
jgi:RHS repeat-associated protein